MSTVEAPSRPRPAWSPSRLDQGERVRAVVIVVLLALILIGLPDLLSTYWLKILTAVSIYSIVCLGLGLLMGRVGLVSLGQIAVLAIGSWVAARLLFGTGLPFPIVLLMSGFITMVIGTIVGLPALRVSGLYLALITLMLAGAISVVLAATDFPNGAGGFLGHTESTLGGTSVRRPAIGESDPAFFRYSVVVAAAMFLLVLWHIRSKVGRSWEVIRQSEPAALAAGINTRCTSSGPSRSPPSSPAWPAGCWPPTSAACSTTPSPRERTSCCSPWC